MNLPNKLTVLRVILVPFFVAVFLLSCIPYHHLIAMGIFAIASLTDMLDGYIARKYNLITDFGKFLDPIADKILVNAAAVLLVFLQYDWVGHNESNWFGRCILVIALVYISREMIVSGFRLVASGKGLVLAADKLGKIKTITQMIGLIVLLPLASFASHQGLVLDVVAYSGLAILSLSAVVSMVSCVNYIVKNKQVLQGAT
ncbi:MAG: CDP-diacylglycerol--glycerol-3-phosphate 3-phosphatidyltransferase [Firmicutes bacterium]|nr:CDP-diacylglycerol--glycerol-3-phosphate 3-phosphatidyltransferase [Bacillota bacterium]